MQTIDLTLLGLKDGQRVLDLGCGTGRHVHAVYYGAQCEIVGLDLGFDDLVTARKGFEEAPDLDPESRRAFLLTQGDALRLPFEDAAFDKVICSEVLEHIPDYKAAIAEIDRILKPNATAAISVPRYWPEWVCWQLSDDYHNEPGGHVRIFREKELAGAFEERGFTRFAKHYAHGLHSPYWWIKCAVGPKNETNPLVRAYHRLLVWDILERPRLTRLLEAGAAPMMGKSLVLYFTKGAA